MYVNLIDTVLWMGYIVPLMLAVIAIFIALIVCCASSFQWKRKIKLLKAYGFKRCLDGVPAYGNGTFYRWENKQNNMRFTEAEINTLKHKELKEKVNI